MTAAPRFGRTVGDLLRFLRQPRIEVWVAVRTGVDNHYYLTFTKSAVRRSLAFRDAGDLMPSDYDAARQLLRIGSFDAVIQAEAQPIKRDRS